MADEQAEVDLERARELLDDFHECANALWSDPARYSFKGATQLQLRCRKAYEAILSLFEEREAKEPTAEPEPYRITGEEVCGECGALGPRLGPSDKYACRRPKTRQSWVWLDQAACVKFRPREKAEEPSIGERMVERLKRFTGNTETMKGVPPRMEKPESTRELLCAVYRTLANIDKERVLTDNNRERIRNMRIRVEGALAETEKEPEKPDA